MLQWIDELFRPLNLESQRHCCCGDGCDHPKATFSLCGEFLHHPLTGHHLRLAWIHFLLPSSPFSRHHAGILAGFFCPNFLSSIISSSHSRHHAVNPPCHQQADCLAPGCFARCRCSRTAPATAAHACTDTTPFLYARSMPIPTRLTSALVCCATHGFLTRQFVIQATYLCNNSSCACISRTVNEICFHP